VIHGFHTTSLLMVTPSLTDWQTDSVQIQIASCDTIHALTGIADCTDGDAFTLNRDQPITTGHPPDRDRHGTERQQPADGVRPVDRARTPTPHT